MRIQAVDFASVAWAMCIGDGDPAIEVQLDAFCFDSETKAMRALTWWYTDSYLVSDPPAEAMEPDVMLVEDLPQRLPRWDTTVKNVARMQGRLVERMAALGVLEKVLFVPPGTWQQHHGVQRKGKEGARAKAAEYGYEPPDLLSRYEAAFEELKGDARQKVRERLKKLQTDYDDAYLLYRWGAETYAEHGTLDVPTTTRYTR